MTVATVDRPALETKVKSMYSDVAANPHGQFHFEIGQAMAEALRYSPADLDSIPSQAIDSFAGVGYFFHLANLQKGDRVVALGSGSGMDSFIAAFKVRPSRAAGVSRCNRCRRLPRRARQGEYRVSIPAEQRSECDGAVGHDKRVDPGSQGVKTR